MKFETKVNTGGMVNNPITFETKHILALSEESLPPASVKRTVFIPTGIAQMITGIANKIPRTPATYKNPAQITAINTSRTKDTT